MDQGKTKKHQEQEVTFANKAFAFIFEYHDLQEEPPMMMFGFCLIDGEICSMSEALEGCTSRSLVPILSNSCQSSYEEKIRKIEAAEDALKVRH
jgi:hypothetical protein